MAAHRNNFYIVQLLLIRGATVCYKFPYIFLFSVQILDFIVKVHEMVSKFKGHCNGLTHPKHKTIT